ncbi:MFS transporter [Campylobacter sp. MG1]|uniref:MFS transporter n=1 Tax=Campylobacter sp. MG1 TaxID=2976332 RepID=UPI00226CDCA7|nr:MFS transporter [Campylobacter sp. MG1]
MFSNYTKRQKLIIASSSLGMCLEMMDIMFIAYSLNFIIQEFSLSNKEAGAIPTITNLSMLIGGFILSYLADKYGRIKVFTYSILLFAIGTSFIYFANTYYWLIFFRVLSGLGVGGEYGVGMSLIKDEFGKTKMGKYSSMITIFGQITAAFVAILAGILLSYGWRYLFLVGLIPVALAFYIRVCLKDVKSNNFVKLDYAKVFQDNFYLTIALSIMVIVQVAGYFGMINWLPSMAQKALNLSSSNSSYWMISTIFGMCVGMIIFGRIFDKFGPRISYGVFLIGSAILVYAFTLVTNYTQLLIIGFVIGFFSNGMFAGYGALVNIIYPSNISASVNNLIINIGRAIGGFSSVIIGILLDLYNNTFVVMAFLSMLYLTSFCIMLSRKELKRDNFIKSKERI